MSRTTKTVAAAFATTLALAGSAHAGTLSTSSGWVKYEAAVNETNTVTVIPNGAGNFRVTDTTANIVVSAPCVRIDFHTATCSGTYVNVLAGNLNDTVSATQMATYIQMSGGLGDDTLRGGGGADTLVGDEGADTLEGNGNNDYLHGRAGTDTLRGGPGNDYAYGNEDNDTLEGAAGNDQLWGGAGNDTMRGGDNDDWMNGEAGVDNFSGDAGVDNLQAGDRAADGTIACGTGSDHLTFDSGFDATPLDCESRSRF
jgi:Ca2+-binding RTX toxin-like protein